MKNIISLENLKVSKSGAYNRGGAYIKSYDLRGGAYNRGGAYIRAGLQSSAYGIWNTFESIECLYKVLQS